MHDYEFEPPEDVPSNANDDVQTLNPQDIVDDDVEDPVVDNDVEIESTNSEESGGNEDDSREILVVDDPKSTLNPLTRFLFNFAARFALSDKAMAALMQGLTSIHCNGDFFLPKDFRTVERAIMRSENSQHTEQFYEIDDDDDDTLSSATGVSVVYVCSNCNLHEFDVTLIKAKKPCSQCGVTSIRCGYQRCKAFCIATSTMGNKSINQLTVCSDCKAGPTSPRTTRLYFLNFENHVKRFFKSEQACLDALAPFGSLVTVLKSSQEVVTETNWLETWTTQINALKFKSENWHGERFFNHPVWREHGVRSLLLSLFIDWFPPFKKKTIVLGSFRAR